MSTVFVSQYERICRGGEVLDMVLGPEWVDMVDLDRLRIMSHENCVLAQVFEDEYPPNCHMSKFYYGLTRIAEALHSSVITDAFSWYGFSALWFDNQDDFDERWRIFIRRRRKELRNAA